MTPPGLAPLGIGLGALRDSPLRSILSALGVVMGVAALVAVLSVGDGVQAFAREQLRQTTDLQAVYVTPLATREVDGVQVPNPAPPAITPADAAGLAARVPPGTGVTLARTGAGLVTRVGWPRPRAAVVEARWGAAAGPAPATGRGLDAALAADTVALAVVSHGLARLVAGTEPVAAALGQRIRVGLVDAAIVGVHDSSPQPGPFRVELPYALGDRAMVPGGAPRLPALVAVAPGLEAAPALRQAVEAWVAGRDSAWRAAVAVQSREGRLAQALQGVLVFKILMGTIAGVSLLVGGIGIMNVLLAAVAERTREIGIRKAAGARRRDVLLQFLAESVVITGAGSAVGVAAGYAIAVAGTALMRSRAGAAVQAGLSPSTVAVAVAAAVAVGIAFGMYPALRAARLDPIEAIRHE